MWIKTAHAAVPQYITVTNGLQVSSSKTADPTASPIVVRFFNDSAYACFTTTLDIGDTVVLVSGVRSPCVTPILTMSITPLATKFEAVCFTPSQPTPVNASYKVVTAAITSLTGPVFDTSTGVLIAAGTPQVSITGS